MHEASLRLCCCVARCHRNQTFFFTIRGSHGNSDATHPPKSTRAHTHTHTHTHTHRHTQHDTHALLFLSHAQKHTPADSQSADGVEVFDRVALRAAERERERERGRVEKIMSEDRPRSRSACLSAGPALF